MRPLKKQVLLLCTRNSCRSQMAEGIVNHDLRDSWEASSAGLVPSEVHPMARKVMDEIGIDISGHFSKYLEQFENARIDVIITLCGDVDAQCPTWVGKQRKVHIGILDPASAAGSEDEILQVFRIVRDDIRREIVPYLKSIAKVS